MKVFASTTVLVAALCLGSNIDAQVPPPPLGIVPPPVDPTPPPATEPPPPPIVTPDPAPPTDPIDGDVTVEDCLKKNRDLWREIRDRADANKDGKLDGAERHQAAKLLSEHVRKMAKARAAARKQSREKARKHFEHLKKELEKRSCKKKHKS